MSGKWAGAFGLTGIVLFVVAVVLGGILFPGYDPISQLISESYAVDAPHGVFLRFYLYIPSGILVFLFAILAMSQFPKSAGNYIGLGGIGVFYGLATVIASLFPCDAGCNKAFIDPTLSQFIHNLVGLVTYATVPLCLLLFGFSARNWRGASVVSRAGIVCGMVSFAFVIVLFAQADSPWAGLFQRIVESAVLLWIAICSWLLIKSPVQKKG